MTSRLTTSVASAALVLALGALAGGCGDSEARHPVVAKAPRPVAVTTVPAEARALPGDLDVTIVAKDLGYELRCAPPGAHDIQYSRSLGYWATRFLLEGGSNAMVTIAVLPPSSRNRVAQ